MRTRTMVWWFLLLTSASLCFCMNFSNAHFSIPHYLSKHSHYDSFLAFEYNPTVAIKYKAYTHGLILQYLVGLSF